MGECPNSALRDPSGCLLDDRECRPGVAMDVAGSCGVPVGNEHAGRVSRPGVLSGSY